MTKTVMLVDDSPSIRAIFGARLAGAGYTVLEADDGDAALEKLDGQPIGLIVSDLSMPRMDGISFLRYVRAHPRYKFTPVIVLTTESRSHVVKTARDQGAQAFLTKPVSPTDLLSAVARLCV